jgi:hypothetical protein
VRVEQSLPFGARGGNDGGAEDHGRGRGTGVVRRRHTTATRYYVGDGLLVKHAAFSCLVERSVVLYENVASLRFTVIELFRTVHCRVSVEEATSGGSNAQGMWDVVASKIDIEQHH